MSPEFLSAAELSELSGYVQPASIRRWLDRHGVRYMTARDGSPLVRRDEMRPGDAEVRINLESLRGTRRASA